MAKFNMDKIKGLGGVPEQNENKGMVGAGLLNVASQAQAALQKATIFVPYDKIVRNPMNKMSLKNIDELAQLIELAGLQQPLVVARHGARIVGVGRKSAFEVYPSFLGHGDIEQILSMFYYDVCLNHNGIELRTADSLAPRYAASYAQLIKTLFSSHAAQEGILRRYAGANSAQIEAAKVGICCNGYQAQVYGRAAAGEVSWLLAQAKSHAAAPDDRRLLEPLAELAAKKRTPREISGCV